MTPSVLFLDLDDTLVSFSSGQDDLWARVLHAHESILTAVSPGIQLERVAAAIAEVVPVYWGDAQRAAQGRLELFRARQEVLSWALERLELALPRSVVEQVANAYTREKEDAVAPLGDAIEVVKALRKGGFGLALLTNGGAAFQRRKLTRYGLEPLFDAIVVEGEWGVGKPHPSVFEEGLRQLGVSANQVWMVGDNYEADICGAAQVGVAGVWIHQGRQLPAGPATPLHSIAHVRELLTLLEVKL